MTPDDLKSYALAMQQYGVRRLQAETGGEDSEGFCIEMDASAFAPLASETPNVPADLGAGEKKCACDHLQESEHNNEGLCIAGACPVSVCHPEATAKPT